jgi:hypothetical protein
MPVQKITPIRAQDPEAEEAFNPYKKFNGILIPEGIVRKQKLSFGAKIVYGRLCRYAGASGRCFPAVETLAKEIGVHKRQARRYLKELEKQKFIRRVERVFPDQKQMTNSYVFLRHPCLGLKVSKGGHI